MKGPNGYAGQALPNQVSSAYTNALGGATDMMNMGSMGIAPLSAAGDLFSTMGGFTPSDITAGSLASTDLAPYMNPFTKDVTNATMDELWRQEQKGRMSMEDRATKAGAFGGDRMAIESASNARNYRDQKGQILSQLNQANFNNAQQMATGDLNRRLTADQNNQGMRSNLMTTGAAGLAGLGTLGTNLFGEGQSSLSNLANMGFGFGNDTIKNNLAAGALQQQTMQSIIDAAKGQYSGYANAPYAGLEAVLKSILSPGNAGTTTSKTSASTLEKIAGIGSAVGALLPW